MAWFTSLLIYLLLGLAPFAFGALLVPVLCQGKVVSPPRSFLVTHLVLAGLTRPFLDLAANIWLLQPVFLILSSVPSFIIAFAGLTLSFLLSNVFQNLNKAASILDGRWHELNPFDIKKNIQDSAETLYTSLGDFLENTNFTEVFQLVKPLKGESWDEFMGMYGPRANYNYTASEFSELLRNLTISESTMQYIDTVNIAVISLLENVQVSSIFNTSRIPQNLHTSFDEVSEALRDLAKNLNFTELLREATIPRNLQVSLDNLGDSLGTAGRNLNLTEVFEAALSSNQEVFSQVQSLPFMKHPAMVFQSADMSAEAASWIGLIRGFLSSIPFQFYIAAGVFLFLLLVGIPLTFVSRAALQDGCLWLVTRRYEYKIPSAQRSASGWMFVAATSGLMLAATEAFPYCCFYGFLYGSDFLSAQSVFFLLVHTLTAAPIRAASQMRIAEAGARKDVLKDPKPGFFSGFVWAALTNSIFSVWWVSFSGILMVLLTNVWSPVFFVMSTDAFVAGCGVLWGRRICRRVLKDEQRMIEDRERKRD